MPQLRRNWVVVTSHSIASITSSFSSLSISPLSPSPSLSLSAQVFRCLPSSDVRNMTEMDGYLAQPGLVDEDPARAHEELKKIRGFLVQFPLQFLAEQNLLPPIGSREAMVPREVWT